MKILSLDMSTRKTGWAIFDDDKLIKYNLIEVKNSDVYARISYMYTKIQELITSNNIECIVCEDVPVSGHSNLEVGKNLCVLQGCLLALVNNYNLKFNHLKPTEWRAKIGINHTLYICKKCKKEKEVVSGDNSVICSCGNKTFEKKQLNDRESLKGRAIELANSLFNLNLTFISKSSSKNQDDEAEAILIGYAYLLEQKKGFDINGR